MAINLNEIIIKILKYSLIPILNLSPLLPNFCFDLLFLAPFPFSFLEFQRTHLQIVIEALRYMFVIQNVHFQGEILMFVLNTCLLQISLSHLAVFYILTTSRNFWKLKHPAQILSQSSIRGQALKSQTFSISSELSNFLNLPSKSEHILCTDAILQPSGATKMVRA